MRKLQVDVRLLSAKSWNEGGSVLRFQADGDTFARGVRTIGRHPALFIYDPLPIIKELRTGAYVIIDAHEEPFSLAALEIDLLRRAFAPTAKLVLYSAQNILKRYPVPFRWFERLVMRAAAAVYVCNSDASQVLRAKGYQGIVRLLPLGVDRDPFINVARAQSGQTFRIAYVGRLEPHKGVDVLLRAAAGVADCSVAIAGAGPEEQMLKSLASALDMTGRVTFYGHIKHADLTDFYSSCDVVVIPSRPTPSWQEQFCRVAVEAMASGVPVIASSTGALPEVIGESGVLVTPDDAPALRQALLELMLQPARAAELSSMGRRRASAFTWEAVARQHRDLFDEVLA